LPAFADKSETWRANMKNFVVGLIAGAALGALGPSLKNHSPAPSATAQFGSAADAEEVSCTTGKLQHNRQLVRAFFAPERSPLDAYNMMTPDYVQHNEGVKRFGQINGLKDREAFKVIDEILTKNAQRPELFEEAGRPKNEMAFKIIANCDYVIAVHRTYMPDPQKNGDYYMAFDYELWRIKDGKFAEHWDSQRIPTPVPELMRTPLRSAQPNSPGADAPANNR
jgi:predicted SnoaL-like aldol condensation-catalyzing enzyme